MWCVPAAGRLRAEACLTSGPPCRFPRPLARIPPRQVLAKNALRLEAMFKEWDEDGDGTVNKKEWRKAMPAIGIQTSDAMLDRLFDTFDEDGSGEIDFEELRAALRKPSLRKGGALAAKAPSPTRAKKGEGAPPPLRRRSSALRGFEMDMGEGVAPAGLTHRPRSASPYVAMRLCAWFALAATPRCDASPLWPLLRLRDAPVHSSEPPRCPV